MDKPATDEVVLVSACLLGIESRYNGRAKLDPRVLEWAQGRRIVPVCPESLSGLPVPRPSAQYESGDGTLLRSGKSRVLLEDGQDVSLAFLHGAAECVKIARLTGATSAVLKDRSPSCGVYQVYSDGHLIAGIGCFTALLLLEGIAVKSEDDLQ